LRRLWRDWNRVKTQSR